MGWTLGIVDVEELTHSCGTCFQLGVLSLPVEQEEEQCPPGLA